MKYTNVESYVPESSFFENKHHVSARVCNESCAVVEPAAGFRILAARGEKLTVGTDLRTAIALTAEEINELTHACREGHRVLMSANGRPMLVYADWIRQLGLLLVILPDCELAAACEALNAMGRQDILRAPCAQKSNSEACRLAYRVLLDIFAYTDAMMGIRTAASYINQNLTLRIAAFAGCHTDSESVYSLTQRAETLQSPRTVAFLLCVFLFLRQRDGSLITDAETERLCYHISIERNTHLKASSVEPIFASARCFDHCSVHIEPNGTMHISFTPELQPTFTLGADHRIPISAYCLRIDTIRISA
ncbi:MAG: hypothetical protein IJW16_03620 [Clostridia bacterium]|nr:hypothetical protein [Clostridia bacterium]